MSDKRTKLVLNLNEDINDCLWLSLFNEESSEDIFTFHNKHETNPFLHFSDIDISDFNPKWIQVLNNNCETNTSSETPMWLTAMNDEITNNINT